MIYIDSKRCDGCGICADICPTGAITLRNNTASIEQDLCEECQVCMYECPQDAIQLMEQPDVVEEQSLSTVPASKIEVLPPELETKPVPTSLVASVGTAIIGVLPRLASLAVDWLERRSRSIKASPQSANTQSLARNTSRQSNGRGQGLGRGQGRGRPERGRGREQGKRRRQRRNRR
ncbi:MAG: 4Fe-4S binding protein [Chloroflexota bacterium]|nr:4Fe-4S binding protein [Chloroflexota bacterium]